MRSIWVGNDRGKRKYFRDYAARFKVMLSDKADILVATDDDGALCGFTAVMSRSEVIDIVFMYVEEKKRNTGVGAYMLKAVEKAAVNSRIGTLRCVMPRTETAENLFAGEGYRVFQGNTEYTVSLGSLYYSPVFRRQVEGRKPARAKNIAELSQEEKGMLNALYQEQAVSATESYNKRLSCAVFGKEKIGALVLVEALSKGIIIGYMYTEKGHPEYLLDCLRLLNKTLSENGEEKKDLQISIDTDNEKDLELLRYLAGNTIPIGEIVREAVAVKRLQTDRGTVAS